MAVLLLPIHSTSYGGSYPSSSPPTAYLGSSKGLLG